MSRHWFLLQDQPKWIIKISICVNEGYVTLHGLHTYSRARTRPDGSFRVDVVKAMRNPSRIVARTPDQTSLVYDREGIIRTRDFVN